MVVESNNLAASPHRQFPIGEKPHFEAAPFPDEGHPSGLYTTHHPIVKDAAPTWIPPRLPIVPVF